MGLVKDHIQIGYSKAKTIISRALCENCCIVQNTYGFIKYTGFCVFIVIEADMRRF